MWRKRESQTMTKRVERKVLYERKERERREKKRGWIDRKMERQRGGSYRYNLDERHMREGYRKKKR